MPHRCVELLLLTIASPLKAGLYINGTLQREVVLNCMCSDGLTRLYEEITENQEIDRILYARGPGSFMGIKLTYIFIKTLSIVKNIEVSGADAFAFNGNQPIKAYGNLYFVKKDDTISLQKIEDAISFEYTTPRELDYSVFSKDIEPLYILPAVR